MAPRTAAQVFRLSAVIPCGQAGYWKIMLDLDAKGAWSIADLHGETAGQVRDLKGIRNYVSALAKGGFVRAVGTRPHPGGPAGVPTKLYRLAKKPAAAPSLRPDGSVVPVAVQQRVWNAMRALRQFTADELAFAAATGGKRVPRITVERYLTDLNAAGYLAGAQGRGRAMIWRLKPGMNTGPLAPKILALHVVFDANRRTVIAPKAVEAGEVAS